VAITDHGNLSGTLDFDEKAKKHGVKPIFGCETYVATDRDDKTERRSNHLILLAENNVGWKNLSFLNSMGYVEGFYYSPRIDKKLLREHADGLVATSACLGGEVGQNNVAAGDGGLGEGGARVRRHLRPGTFLLELMPNALEDLEKVIGLLVGDVEKDRLAARPAL
jgi:DNA polymerase-3 subunit alpha